MTAIIPCYHENPSQRSPCLLVLDLCRPGTLRDAPAAPAAGIAALDEGLRLLLNDLQADQLAQHKVQLSIVEAGGPGPHAEVLVDWMDAAEFRHLPVLQRGSASHLAQGMRLALQHVEQHKQTLRRFGVTYTRPWIMVVSSGVLSEPMSVWEGVGQDCRQAERDKRCVIFPILMDDGDSTALRMLSAAPVAHLSSARFRNYFRWLAASLASTSRSVPGDTVPLPSAQTWAIFRS